MLKRCGMKAIIPMSLCARLAAIAMNYQKHGPMQQRDWRRVMEKHEFIEGESGLCSNALNGTHWCARAKDDPIHQMEKHKFVYREGRDEYKCGLLACGRWRDDPI